MKKGKQKPPQARTLNGLCFRMVSLCLASAERCHCHVQAEESVVHECVFDSIFVVQELGAEREQYCDGTYLPYPCTCTGNLLIFHVVLCLRPGGQDGGDDVTKQGDDDCLACNPDED